MAVPNYEVVPTLVPEIYRKSIAEFGLHPNTDMSRSDKCHTLTLDLMRDLRNKKSISARRELHQTPSGLWHYVLAYGEIDASPTNLDIITDLNPWLFTGGEAYTGYLHAPRNEVIASLHIAGAPEEHIALRSLATIVLPHTEDLLTSHTHPPLPSPI